jgi:hypothetical protein
VELGAGETDVESLSDLLVGKALLEQLQDFLLPRCERPWIGRPSSSHSVTKLPAKSANYTSLRKKPM